MLNKQKIFLLIYKKAKNNFKGSGILKKYPFLRPLKKFIANQAKSNFVTIDGHKMFLDSKDSLELSINEIYEELETSIIKNKIKNGSVVLDVGANIGYYTLILARLVGKEGKVYAFEPDPDNFNILKKNIEINGYQNVVLENIALSNSNGKAKLFLSKESMGDHQLDTSESTNQKFVEVNAIKLDDYFKNHDLVQKISFMKIDVEGSELKVFEGMKSIFENNNKLKILMEFLPKKFDVLNLLDFLDGYGFKFCCIDGLNNKIEEPQSANQITQRFDGNNIDDNPQIRNLLCIIDR